VNTFLSAEGSPFVQPDEVIRSTEEEKRFQIEAMRTTWKANDSRANAAIEALKNAAVQGENLFEQLMEACKVCSLGQISRSLYEVGGQYRRNM
jgi:methylmalonyl-CoA mutase